MERQYSDVVLQCLQTCFVVFIVVPNSCIQCFSFTACPINHLCAHICPYYNVLPGPARQPRRTTGMIYVIVRTCLLGVYHEYTEGVARGIMVIVFCDKTEIGPWLGGVCHGLFSVAP